MRAQDYAAEVQRLLQRSLPAPPPAAVLLVQRARELDALWGGPGAPAVEAAEQAFRSALEDVKADLASALADAVPIRSVADLLATADLTGPRALSLEATLGPLHVAARSPSVQLVDPDDGRTFMLGPLPPNAFTGRLDAGPVRGGGSLVRLPDGLSGLLAADLGFAQAAVLASLRAVDGQPSFLAVLSAGFTPGLQVGFGFAVGRIGGVVGINRTVASDVLSRRLGDGSAAHVLFPLDVGKDGRAALAAAEDVFRPAQGSFVAGPTFRLSWLEVHGRGFLSADVALLVELPGPDRVVLVGVVKAGIDKIVRLNAHVAGVVDLAQQRATLEASLVDSGALGVFTVHGDLAFAAGWGPTRYTVLSLGGFYPGFRPEPAQLRPLTRLGLRLDSPLPGLRLKAEGYVAATSNTLQLGGRLDVGYDAGVASLSGFIGVDTLVQFTPFHIRADLAAGMEVRLLGQTFCGISLRGTLDAPDPVTIAARLTVETFLKDFHLDETWTFGAGGSLHSAPAVRAIDVLEDEVRPRNLRGLGGADPTVRLATLVSDDELAIVTARLGLEWRQHAVPLETLVDRVAGTPTEHPATLTARVDAPGVTASPVSDRFAPGSFVSLTSAEALNGPSYDELPAGVQVTGSTIDGAPQPADNDIQVLRKVGGQGQHLSPVTGPGPHAGLVAFSLAALAMVAQRAQAATVATRTPQVTLVPEAWLADDDAHPSHTQAFLAARPVGAMVLAGADHDQPVTLAGV